MVDSWANGDLTQSAAFVSFELRANTSTLKQSPLRLCRTELSAVMQMINHYTLEQSSYIS